MCRSVKPNQHLRDVHHELDVAGAGVAGAVDLELLDTGLEGRDGAPPLALVMLIDAAHYDQPNPSKDVNRGFLGTRSRIRKGAHAHWLESDRRTVAYLAAGLESRLW